jgi:hypothetical protein
MDQYTPEELRRPPMDDRPLWDIVLGVYGYPALLLAHKLKLFPLLAAEPRTLAEICDGLHLARRPVAALVTAATAPGFLHLQEGRYGLTPLAAQYLLESSPTYFGGELDLTIANHAVWSLESLEQAVRTDRPPIYSGQDVFKSHEEQADLARAFTQAMHGSSMSPALAWPECIDLSGHRLLLDVGGGSGAHALGAVLRWPHLQAVVFDLPPVCEVAQEIITRHGLQQRVSTQAGDMWEDAFPPADLHFYSQIYHDWPVQKCQVLTQKSFASLQPGGRILIHEMLYNDDKTGPFPAAAFNIIMLLWTTEGQHLSGRELSTMLAEAGFTDITVTPTFGYWSLVTGRKP